MRDSIPASLRRAAGRLRHRWSLPYATFARPPLGGSVSDLFLWRGDVAGTRFIAENTLALLTAEPIHVMHRLSFFDPEGLPAGTVERHGAETYTTIEPREIDLPLGTFVHGTFYDPSSLRPEARELLNLRRAHRGYCEYRRHADSVWSAVHGNVGGITSEARESHHRHRLLARRRVSFLYTPQVHLHPHQTATIFLLNPCREPESIVISLQAPESEPDAREPLQTLQIPSLGVRGCVVKGKDGYLSCLSRVPMCRPLVFVEEEGNTRHFDVFHT
jgi:hypothetical protein